jgi:hypothetical protein
LNNNGINHLHGGRFGFDTKVWSSHTVETETESGVVFSYLSPDGDELYPGTLEVGIFCSQQYMAILFDSPSSHLYVSKSCVSYLIHIFSVFRRFPSRLC